MSKKESGDRIQIQREVLAETVAGEIRQREEEGYDVSVIREAYPDPAGLSKADLEAVCAKLGTLEMRADFLYEEPSDWDGIVAARPGPLVDMDTDLVDGDLFDRLHGAWLGKCVGCVLGKPCEMLTGEQIAFWLKKADAYPLDDYFPDLDGTSELPDWLAARLALLKGRGKGRREVEGWPHDTLRGEITMVGPHEGIDYSVVRLELVEVFGLDFAAGDIAKRQTSRIPYRRLRIPERAAYHNTADGLEPPETATWLNPYRETVSATTRADVWAFVYPGQPGKAVELAFRDASWTHTKNGIYGELFAAAMISAAFSTSDVEAVVRVGLQAIPERSRLAEAVRCVIGWHDEQKEWETAWAEVDRVYGHYEWAHTIPNVCWIVLGLLYGEGDFETSVAITVMCGMDTDATAATVGSVLGTMQESHGIPEKFGAPLNDRVESSVAGVGTVRISEFARRSLDVVRGLGTNP